MLRGNESVILRAAFSSDGTRVLTTHYDGTARIQRLDGSGEPVVLRGERPVVSAAFSRDGARVVTTSEDGTAKVWQADGSGESNVLRGDTGRVNSAAFSSDGTLVITASSDGTARIWRITWPELFEFLASATSSCLTIEERRRYLGEVPAESQRAWERCETRFGRNPQTGGARQIQSFGQ